MKPLKLFNYGEYNHPKGIQVLDTKSAHMILKDFYSLSQRIKRHFKPIPIYIGHPDEPDFSNQPGHTDTAIYGQVKAIHIQPDGLWINAHFNPKGQELIQSGSYKFLSARWELKPIGNHRFRPFRILSIGLTNTPNIPCDAISLTAANSHTLKTHTITQSLKNTASPNTQKELISLVHNQMQKESISYNHAWEKIKKSRNDLFYLL